MSGLAVLFIVLGFGTFVLEAFDRQFRILAWADDYQPWVSIGLGVLGVVILVVKFLAGRGGEPQAAESSAESPVKEA